MSRIKVAIVRGGPSREFDISLNTGKMVAEQLASDLYEPIDIFIDKKGVWHRGGIPFAPERALSHADVVFNALHGAYGEDGTLQQILDRYGIPYTGSGAFASALGMNKVLTKQYLTSFGIKTPYFKVVSPSANLEQDLVEIFRSLPHAFVCP
jgi:D-alanine--D-alanine ligase